MPIYPLQRVFYPQNCRDFLYAGGLTEQFHTGHNQQCFNYFEILYYVFRCKCRALDLEGGLEFLKYAINIEKASMIYLSPVQKEHAKRKWLDYFSKNRFIHT
jgi:hypothetical protein